MQRPINIKNNTIDNEYTEPAQMLSYALNHENIEHTINKLNIKDQNLKNKIINAINLYISKTKYRSVNILKAYHENNNVFIFYTKCENHSGNITKKIWKLGYLDYIQSELERYKNLSINDKGSLLRISNNMSDEDYINYYNYYNDFSVIDTSDRLRVIEYDCETFPIDDSINIKQYLTKLTANFNKPINGLIKSLSEKDLRKTSEAQTYKGFHNIINKLFSYKNDNTDKKSSNTLTNKEFIGLHIIPDTIITNSKLYSNKTFYKKTSGTKKNINTKYEITKSEIPITIDTQNKSWLTKTPNRNTIIICDIHGVCYELNYNSRIELKLDLDNIKKEIEQNHKEDKFNIVIVGIEKSRRYTKLLKILSEMDINPKEKKLIGFPDEETFIKKFQNILDMKIENNVSLSLNNIDTERIFIDNQYNDSAISYDYSEASISDKAYDFAMLENELKLEYLSNMSFDEYENRIPLLFNKTKYDTTNRLQSAIDIEDFLYDNKIDENLSTPVHKDYRYLSLIKIISIIRNIYFNNISDNNSVIQYYQSLLYSSIKLLKKLYMRYEDLRKAESSSYLIKEINYKRKIVFGTATNYIKIITSLENNSEKRQNIINHIQKLTKEYTNIKSDIINKNDFDEAYYNIFELLDKSLYNRCIEDIKNEETFTDTKQLQLLKSTAYFYKGNFPKSFQILKSLINKNQTILKTNDIINFLTAENLFYMEKYNDCIEYYDKMLNTDNKRYYYQSVLKKSIALFHINEKAKAVELIQNTLDKSDIDLTADQIDDLNILHAELLKLLGDFEQSESIYKRILDNDLENINALNGLGNVYIVQNKQKEAIDAFESSLFINRDPYSNYSAYWGLRESILMYTKSENTINNETAGNSGIFTTAYNYGILLESINQKFNISGEYAFTLSKISNKVESQAEKNESDTPEWIRPADNKTIFMRKDYENYPQEKQYNKKTIQNKINKQYEPQKSKSINYKSTTKKQDNIKSESINQPNENKYENLLEKADLFFRKGKYNEASKAYHKYLKYQPKSIKALYNLANCYFKLEQYKKAINLYYKVIEIDHTHFKALYNIGIAYNKQKLYQRAVSVFDIVLKYKKESELARYNKAISLIGIKKYQQAFDTLDEINLNDKSIDDIKYMIHFYKGLCLYKLGEIINESYFHKALKYFYESKKLNETFSLINTYIGKCKIELSKSEPKRIKDTFAILNNAYTKEKEQNSYNEETLIAMGNLLLKSKDTDHAIRAFNKALEINGKSFHALLGLGICMAVQYRYTEATNYFEEIIYNIDDTQTENRLLKKNALINKIKTEYNNKQYMNCLSDIGKLKSFTGVIGVNIRKIRDYCRKYIDEV